MGLCQAPCTGGASQDNYAQTISILQDLLSGRSSILIQQLEARRDTCAENLQFEQAAKLRDAINELNHLFHTQQRLSNAINNCHAVIITRSRAPFAVELFAIYSGLLRGQLRALPGVTSATHLATWLTTTYTQSHTLSTTHVNKSDLDELHIIASWLHRQREQRHVIPVKPTEPHACLTKLQQAIASFDLLSTTPALPSPAEPIASSPFP
jgi:excinuclease ABC subunit C